MKSIRRILERMAADLPAETRKPDPIPSGPPEPAYEGRELVPATLAGRCVNGFERDSGQLVHALPNPGAKGGGAFGKALCGSSPGRTSAGWTVDDDLDRLQALPEAHGEVMDISDALELDALYQARERLFKLLKHEREHLVITGFQGDKVYPSVNTIRNYAVEKERPRVVAVCDALTAVDQRIEKISLNTEKRPDSANGRLTSSDSGVLRQHLEAPQRQRAGQLDRTRDPRA
jgi:hypothetical protein